MTNQRIHMEQRGVPTSSAAGGAHGQHIHVHEHIVGDARFTRLHSDPRFRRLPKNKVKVSVDARFSHALSEKRFRDPGVNKRGFTHRANDGSDNLHKHYQLSEGRSGESDEIGYEGSGKLMSGESNDFRKPSKRKKEKVDIDNVGTVLHESYYTKRVGRREQRTKGEEVVENNCDLGLNCQGANGSSQLGPQRFRLNLAMDGSEDVSEESPSPSSSSSSSSSSSEDESDVREEAADYVDEKIPTASEDTRRLAAVSMDWEHVRAVNLLMLMRSFAPKRGVVHSVTIYPSEFGIQRMEDENLHGPKNILASNGPDEEEDELYQGKLREYEKNKLRYYYAVVDCDSASTAAHLYQNCDGLEFERSSNLLDLRYIPDDMQFLRSPKDVATEIPLEYTPLKFETRALQHSNVKLTWDDDDSVRRNTLMRNFNRIDVNEMDFRDYVASGTSESESEGADERKQPGAKDGVDCSEIVRSKYLSLLADDDESKCISGTKVEKGNMEIKFHTGLDDLSKKLWSKAKNDKADETVWKKYLARREEKKGQRKKRGGNHSSSDEYSTDDGKDDLFPYATDSDPFSDPFFLERGGGVSINNRRNCSEKKDAGGRNQTVAQKDVRRKRKKEETAKKEKESAREQAELDLLLVNDNAMKNGEGVRTLQSEDQSRKKHRLSNRPVKDHSDDVLERKTSSTNFDDLRFTSLFTSHHFSLDPTNPNYSKANSHIAEKQRLRLRPAEDAEGYAGVDDLDLKQRTSHGRDEHAKADLSLLIRSLQSKVESKVTTRRRMQ